MALSQFSLGTAPYRVYNIGHCQTVELMDYVHALEKYMGKKAVYEKLPLQAGDVPQTWADCSALERDFGYRPNTTVEEGIAKFVGWYLKFTHQLESELLSNRSRK